MKKAKLTLILSIILFSLINISLAQAGCINVKVRYQDGCPRSSAIVVKTLPEPSYYIGTTNESGIAKDCSGYLGEGVYQVDAYWPGGIHFAGPGTLVVDGSGNGNSLLTNSTLTYPNGTESCGDSECDGYKYCYSGSPPYVECYHNDTPTHPTTSTWNSECDTKKCCLCSANNKANPQQNFDSSQNGDCPFCQKCIGLDACGYQSGEDLKNECSSNNITGIATCDNTPDSVHFTWDFRNPFTSNCNGVGSCTIGDSTITHTCNQQTCGADCDEHADCGDKCIGEIRYYSGSCLSTCDCSWTTENCDLQDGCFVYDTGCEDRNYYCTPGICDYTYSNRNTDYNDDFVSYCSADTIRKHKQSHDFYCDGSCSDHASWIDDQLVQDCNLQDGWYNTTTNQWISTGQCTEKEQIQQEYRDYTCSAASCTYSVTNNRWIDTGNTRNKPNGTSCNDGLYCTNPDTCTAGVCGGPARDCSSNNMLGIATCDNNPDNYHPTWDFRQAFTSICNEITDSCTTGNPITHTCDKTTCSAQCTQATAATDCPITKICLSNCTCSLDTTPPTINILSPASTYYTSSIPLTFTLSEPSSWCAYSLDEKANKTIWGCKNTTLYLYTPGEHNIIIYAKDYSGNTGASTKEYFTAIFSIGGGGGSGCGFRSCLRM